MNTASFNRHTLLQGCTDEPSDSAQPFLKRAWATLKVWRRRQKVRARLRVELQVMDLIRIEKDAGVPTRALYQEAYKPFWKA